MNSTYPSPILADGEADLCRPKATTPASSTAIKGGTSRPGGPKHRSRLNRQGTELRGLSRRSGPGYAGSHPHVHHNYDEAWYIVEGTMGFPLGEQTYVCSVGSVVFAPQATTPQLHEPGPKSALSVAITTAAALPLMKDLGALAAAGPPDPIALRSLLEGHETHHVGHVDSRSPSPDG